ncbi:hypothetical protein [Sporosarcina sp. FSL W7-1283]|uniref:hypothetical protein n=1 Tax=Sporosarcina sp. FSL W7-1283 TaxID=2921560 RepID=UPI0030F7F2B3
MTEVKENKNTCTAGERGFLFFLNVVAVLYFTFIYQTIWNWFIADYLFVVSYWEMFLGAFILRVILLPSRKYNNIKITEEENKKLSFSTRLENILFIVIGNTLVFAVLFIINLILAYYG